MLRRSKSFVNVKSREGKSKRTTEDGLPSYYSAGGSLNRSEGLRKYKATKSPGNRIPFLFNPFNKGVQDHLEHLQSLLHGYTLHGLPRIPDIYTRGRPYVDRNLFRLEDNWTDVVSGHVSLSKRQKDQQEAIWEFLTTEVEYIHKLKVIIDVFFCCLVNLQSEHILNEIETGRVFSNIVDVYYATCHFWINHTSQVLRVARETREPLNPCLLKSGFLVFDKIFEPYTKYCLEHESCLDYIRLRMKDNDLFRTFILWGETQKQCERLKLLDLIVRPWQRLTKYKLLLYAMRRPLEKMDPISPPTSFPSSFSSSSSSPQEEQEQMSDISETIEEVEKFVNYVNLTMRKRQDRRQMSNMIDRIETYDALDSLSEECDKLVSEYCRVDNVLTCPVPGCSQQEPRILLLEGGLKLKDANTKMDVYCFLFTDLLLVTKSATKRGDKIRVIRPPMRLDKIVVYGLKDISSFLLLYLNEYHVAQSAYTFHGDSRLWIENITKAQIEYREKRSLHMTLSESLILDMYDDGDDDYPSSVERPSSAEPNVSTEPQQPKATLQRSLSFVNLLNPTDGLNRSRPKSTLLTSTQTRSKSQTFLPGCSFSQLDEPCDAAGGEVTTAAAETKTNYLSIPKALASVSGMFRELPSPSDDQASTDLEIVGLDSDPHRTRLNQRRLMRGAGERRYHTADTIQDMKAAAAAAKRPAGPSSSSLHKHCSWNCAGDDRGAQAATVRAWPSSSSDSVQSMLSSSGVSSSGSSLRMSRDSEICEETESELLEADSIFKISEGAISEDDQDDLAEDDATTGSLPPPPPSQPPTRCHTKSVSVGTQTLPQAPPASAAEGAVGDLASMFQAAAAAVSCNGGCGGRRGLRREASPCSSRSMPNIAVLCQPTAADDDDSRNKPNGGSSGALRTAPRRRQISPAAAHILRTQRWTTTVKISEV